MLNEDVGSVHPSFFRRCYLYLIKSTLKLLEEKAKPEKSNNNVASSRGSSVARQLESSLPVNALSS